MYNYKHPDLPKISAQTALHNYSKESRHDQFKYRLKIT